MKKIKIFIASSVTEFHIDRVEIGNFFRRLNDCYLDAGLYFQLMFCEEMDDAVSLGRKQEKYNREIADSDLVFFLFFTKTGQYTLEEFNVAMEAFTQSGKPRIITYFKVVDPHTPTGEVKKFMSYLDQSLGHYYNVYSHIDTLKLGMMMQVKLLGLMGVEARLEDGKVMQGSEEILSLKNVEMVSGHEDLQQLKEEMAALESTFLEAKLHYLENPDDNEAHEVFFSAAQKRNDAKKAIQETESSLYKAIETMYVETSGGKLSPKQVEAYRLMERGKFTAAKHLLDFDEIVSDSRRIEETADKAAQQAQVHVNEQLQLIEVNKTLRDWDSVDAGYQEAVRLEERFNLPKKAMLAYVKHMCLQKHYSKALPVAEQLCYYNQNPKSSVTEADKGAVYHLLGKIYTEIKRFAEAEEAYENAIKIRTPLSALDPAAHVDDLLESYCFLCESHTWANRHDEAEAAGKKALEIIQGVTGYESPRFEHSKCLVLDVLGQEYVCSQKLDEAEKTLQDALAILQRLLANDSKELYMNHLLHLYLTLGNAYAYQKHNDKAERAYKDALDISNKLAEENPDAYEVNVAILMYNLSDVYKDTGRLDDVAQAIEAAVAIARRLYNRDADAFGETFVMCLSGLGDAYRLLNKYAEAESILDESLEICRRMDAQSPGVFELEVAECLYMLSCVYKDTGRVQQAKENCRIAVELFDKNNAANTMFVDIAKEAQELNDELNKIEA